MTDRPPMGHADRATRADLDGLRSEAEREMAELRAEMAALRAEVHAQLPKLMAVNVASMFGVAGLVLGALSLAN
jgi:hypothetical protein